MTVATAFKAHKNGTDQTGLADATWTQVTFGTEAYDVGSHFASNLWTPPSGKVSMLAKVAINANMLINTQQNLAIYKNGTLYRNMAWGSHTGGVLFELSIDDAANGTDTYGVWVFLNTNGATRTVMGGTDLTYFSGYWFSA